MIVHLQKNITAFAGNSHSYNQFTFSFMVAAAAAPAPVGLNDDVKIVFGGVDAMAIRQSEMKLGGI